jgi:hypothetical protein
LQNIGLKANKIVTISIGFQDFGEGIDILDKFIYAFLEEILLEV